MTELVIWTFLIVCCLSGTRWCARTIVEFYGTKAVDRLKTGPI
jgi:hypothetical protein